MKTKVFSAVFAIATLLVLVWSCSTSEPAPAPPPATTAVDVSATDIATTGFTLSFSVAVPELAATDIKLDADATVTSIAVSGAENKVYTVVTSALTEGKVYNVSIGKANYTFNPAPLALTIPKSTDTKVNVTFSNITTTGFTLNLDAVVTGLVATDITLSNSATINNITGADTKTVNVVCSALAAGTTYTVTIAKAGFGFNPIPLTFIVPSAPVAGVQITDFRIVSPTIATLKRGVIPVSTGANTISNAPRWMQADKATVKAYFTLPAGATAAVGTTPLASGGVLNLTSGTATIKVTNGTATADYTITLAAYDATSNPYGIYTPGDLSDMRNGLAGSYKLMNDITLPALTGGDADVVASMGITDYATAGWKPVGIIATAPFTGKFEGNNQIVKNLEMIRNEDDYIGLFGGVSAGTISNIGVITTTNGVQGGKIYSGVLAGEIEDISTINNCYSSGFISGLSKTGGLVGIITNMKATLVLTMTNCYSSVNVNSPAYAGGLVGYTAENISITKCSASGNVTITGTGSTVISAGGLVGNLSSSGSLAKFSNNYATGNVKATNDLPVGGLIGYSMFSGTIENSYATGAVSGNGLKGGLIGNPKVLTAANLYWDTTTTGQTKAYGNDADITSATGKITADMKSQATVTALNGTQTPAPWSYTGGKYPVLVGVGGQ